MIYHYFVLSFKFVSFRNVFIKKTRYIQDPFNEILKTAVLYKTRENDNYLNISEVETFLFKVLDIAWI